jgi:hypothetical protein
VSPPSATSDPSGEVATHVVAGIVNTPVRVLATTADGISTVSDQLVISTGIPDQNSFTVRPHDLQRRVCRARRHGLDGRNSLAGRSLQQSCTGWDSHQLYDGSRSHRCVVPDRPASNDVDRRYQDLAKRPSWPMFRPVKLPKPSCVRWPKHRPGLCTRRGGLS